MKDHEIRELVNELTQAAKEYAHTQQLRAVISRIIHDTLAKNENSGIRSGG